MTSVQVFCDHDLFIVLCGDFLAAYSDHVLPSGGGLCCHLNLFFGF